MPGCRALALGLCKVGGDVEGICTLYSLPHQAGFLLRREFSDMDTTVWLLHC